MTPAVVLALHAALHAAAPFRAAVIPADADAVAADAAAVVDLAADLVVADLAEAVWHF